MPTTPNTTRLVLARFVELAARPRYAHQFFSYLGDASTRVFDLPSAPDATTRSLEAHVDPEVITPLRQQLVVSQTVGFNVAVPLTQQAQLMGGGILNTALADRYYNQAMSRLDGRAWAAIARAAAAGAGLNTAAFSGGNVVNAALSTVTRNMVARAESDLVGDDSPRQSFLHFMSPRAFGAARELFSGQVSMTRLESPMLGVHYDAVTINGIPCIEVQSMPDRLEAAITASSISGNVLTVTLAEGHGFQVGMPVTTTGLSTDVSTAAAITAATATSVSVPLTASDTGDNGTGLLIMDAAISALVPQTMAFWAGDQVPRVTEVPHSRMPHGRAVQIAALSGEHVMEGYARLLAWPN